MYETLTICAWCLIAAICLAKPISNLFKPTTMNIPAVDPLNYHETMYTHYDALIYDPKSTPQQVAFAKEQQMYHLANVLRLEPYNDVIAAIPSISN